MPINETLKKLRKDRGLTQVEFAEKMNCNRQKIADWERGKSTPSSDDLILLSQKFDVSTDYLLGLTEAETSNKDLQFVCDYTGLDIETVKLLYCRNNNVINTTFLNFLINNKTLLCALINYFFSAIYREYVCTDYNYLPLKPEFDYLSNSNVTEKLFFSELLEILPLAKEAATNKLISDKKLKEKLLFATAKSIVDINACEIEVHEILGVDEEEYYEMKKFFHSEEYIKASLEADIVDEIYGQEDIEKFEEENEKRNDFILWFMNELSKQSGGEQNADNTKT